MAGAELNDASLVVGCEKVAVGNKGPLLCLSLQGIGVFFAQIRGSNAVERGLHGAGWDLEWLKEKRPESEHQSGYEEKCLHQIAAGRIGQMQGLASGFKQILSRFLERSRVLGANDPSLEFCL